MEKDDEHTQGKYDFGARIYDSRLGRLLSVDRYSSDFSYQSPYLFAYNSPIWMIDVNGDFGWVAESGWNYSDVEKFATYVIEETKKIQEKAIKQGLQVGQNCIMKDNPEVCFDCCNFAVHLLLNYAYENKKEVSFHLTDGQVISSSDEAKTIQMYNKELKKMETFTVKDKATFERIVQDYTNATSILKDLVSYTPDEESSNVRVGDINNEMGGHVQVVASSKRKRKLPSTFGWEALQGSGDGGRGEVPRMSNTGEGELFRWKVLDIDKIIFEPVKEKNPPAPLEPADNGQGDKLELTGNDNLYNW